MEDTLWLFASVLPDKLANSDWLKSRQKEMKGQLFIGPRPNRYRSFGFEKALLSGKAAA